MNGGAASYGLDDHIYQRLLKERIVFLGSEVRDQNANAICAQMLLLNAEDPEADIFLDSPLAIEATKVFQERGWNPRTQTNPFGALRPSQQGLLRRVSAQLRLTQRASARRVSRPSAPWATAPA